MSDSRKEELALVEKTFHNVFKTITDVKNDPSLTKNDIQIIHSLWGVFYKFWLSIEFNTSTRSLFISNFIKREEDEKVKTHLNNYYRKLYMIYDGHKLIFKFNRDIYHEQRRDDQENK